jgi:hypothetical protein
MSTLLCDRPPARFVDWTSRFVVCKGVGLTVGEKHLEMGDEVPAGVLSAEALRQVYDTPLALIQLIEFAWTIPPLREACARRGVTYDITPSKPQVVLPDVTELNRKELILLCEELGVPFDAKTSAGKMRQDLTALLV